VGHTIVTFDEASFRLVPVYRRVWFLRGQKPKGIFFWSNKKLNIFGALIDGKKLFYEFYNSLNSLTYWAFLENFVETLSKDKKYVFLFDNAPYHKSSVIMEYLESLSKNIVVEFFPPYSPELNPTETCWKILRNNVTNSTHFHCIEEMQRAIEKSLNNHFFMLNVSNYLCR
jgi:transposase